VLVLGTGVIETETAMILASQWKRVVTVEILD